MTEIYVMKATYEKNADDGIEYFTKKDNLAEAVLEAYEAGAVYVRVFECVEVEFNAYRTGVNIDLSPMK